MVRRKSKAPNETLQLVAKRSRRDVLLDEAARQLNAQGHLADGPDRSRRRRSACRARRSIIMPTTARTLSSNATGAPARPWRATCRRPRASPAAASTASPASSPAASIPSGSRKRCSAKSPISSASSERRSRRWPAACSPSCVDLIEEAQRRGEIRACDSQIIAQALIGIVSWVPLAPRWVGDDAGHPRPQRRRRDRPGSQRRRRQSRPGRAPCPGSTSPSCARRAAACSAARKPRR